MVDHRKSSNLPRPKLWQLAFGACVGSALIAGCGGDDSPADPTGGSSTGGSSAGGASATGGSSSCALPTNALACEGMLAPKTTLVDFATYQASGNWGVDTAGDLTGGTSPYDGDGDDSVHVLTIVAESGMLHVTGTVPMTLYAGFVLWFGPCVNASQVMGGTTATSGLSVPIGGDLGGGSLTFQVQTHTNYPVDAPNMKGGCLFSDCARKWDECKGPILEVGAIAADPEVINFPWGDFAGGLPSDTPTTDGSGLVGLQFQFECRGAADCVIDVTLGSIALTG